MWVVNPWPISNRSSNNFECPPNKPVARRKPLWQRFTLRSSNAFDPNLSHPAPWRRLPAQWRRLPAPWRRLPACDCMSSDDGSSKIPPRPLFQTEITAQVTGKMPILLSMRGRMPILRGECDTSFIANRRGVVTPIYLFVLFVHSHLGPIFAVHSTMN